MEAKRLSLYTDDAFAQGEWFLEGTFDTVMECFRHLEGKGELGIVFEIREREEGEVVARGVIESW